MNRLHVLLLFLGLMAAGVSNGQDMDGDEGTPGQYYALLFATDAYEYWGDLENPINDARTLGEELTNSYGVEVELVEDPTLETVLGKIREYATRTYGPNDHLLIFFAGHGKFDEIDGEGYLVTTDSRADDETNLSYFPYSQLRTRVNSIPSQHVLLVLDACFGGTFDPGLRGDDPYAGLSRNEFLARKLRFQTRRYITSGGKEYVPDGRPGYHSPFMRQFLEALRTYGGQDGILTLNEIYQRLEYVDPLPHSGQFGDNEPGSDFLLIAKGNEEAATPEETADAPAEESAPVVTDPGAASDLDALIQQAEAELAGADNTSNAALDALREARALLEKVKQQGATEAASPEAAAETPAPAADAAEPPTPEAAAEGEEEAPPTEADQEALDAAEIDSIYAVTQAAIADYYREALETTKAGIAPEVQQTPTYQQAAEIEERGNHMYGAKLYTQAAALYIEARKTYGQAAAAPVVQEEVPPEILKAITGYAETLQGSLEAEEAGGMSAMNYRSRDWRAFFDAAQDLTATVRPGAAQARGRSATVLVEVDLAYVDAEGQPHQETVKHLWTLQDMGDGWVLTRARPQE